MYIIAEIGLHHGGDVVAAERLIRSAADAGADAVKFQFFTEEDLEGRPPETGWEALKKYELTISELRHLSCVAVDCCVDCGLSVFGGDGFGIIRRSLMGELDFLKIPAPQAMTLGPVVFEYGPWDKPVYCSTYRDHAELARAFQRENWWILHCTPKYPTPWGELGLGPIGSPGVCGWSCHAAMSYAEQGAMLATALGATVLEFHFMDWAVKADSPDYCVSIYPEVMRSIRGATAWASKAL